MDKPKAPFHDNIEINVIIVLFTLMLAITAFTVASRYLFSFTFSWAEQLTRIMFVWITFAGISWAGKLGVHMRVSAVASILGARLGRRLILFGDAVTVFFGFYMAYKIFMILHVVYTKGQIFATVPWIPVWVMYLAGVLGMTGLSLRVIQSRYRDMRAAREAAGAGKEVL